MSNPQPPAANAPNRALAPQGAEQAAPLLSTNDNKIIAAIAKHDPDLVMRAMAIIGSHPGDPEKKVAPCSVALAFSAAKRERDRKQVLDRDFYLNTTDGVIMDAARGIQRDVALDAGEFTVAFRPCTPEENDDLNAQPGDMTLACEITVLSQYRAVLETMKLEKEVLGQIITRYRPITGLGLLRKEDRYTNRGYYDKNLRQYVNKPEKDWREIPLQGGWTWGKKVQYRAYKAALRLVPGMQATADELREDAEAEGLDLDLPDKARPTRDQMARHVQDVRRAAADTRTEAERQADRERTIAARKAREAADDAAWDRADAPPEIIVGDEPPPEIIVGDEPPPDDEYDEPSDGLTSADADAEYLAQQQAEGDQQQDVPPAVCPICGKGMWDNRFNKRNPRAPDYKCKDKSCEGVYWPGQWPPPNHPDDEVIRALTAAAKAIYPSKEKRDTAFRDWFANNFPEVNIDSAKNFADYFKALTPDQGKACLALLQETQAALAASQAE